MSVEASVWRWPQMRREGTSGICEICGISDEEVQANEFNVNSLYRHMTKHVETNEGKGILLSSEVDSCVFGCAGLGGSGLPPSC